MFYGTHFIMSPPSKSRLKRQSQLLSSMLSRTLSYKSRDLEPAFCSPGASDDPAELSTQLSAPGVLKVFGDSVCTGAHYKSVLATAASSAQELVKEALERYALSPECAGQYVLCDAVGRAGSSGQRWQAECFRVFGDNEKPLLIQELWKPREGLSRRFELRKRSDVEELAARDVDTVTAGINAQARRLQRTRAKGTATATGARRPSPPCLRRSLSETSLSTAPSTDVGRIHYATLPASRGPDEPPRDAGGSAEEGAMRPPLHQSPHLLLLQGYSQQHDSLVYMLNRDLHTVGQRTPASRPSINLAAPDILPLHCTIRHRHGRAAGDTLVLEPIAGAPVAVNFIEAGSHPVELHHGDLLSLGLYYLLLFKDPRHAQPLPPKALARLGAAPRSCRLCGALLGAPGATHPPKPGPEPAQRRQLQLTFEPSQEDALLQRILTLVEPAGDDHKLAPAFLLCLCVQHAAACFGPDAFGQFLLKMTGAIRDTVWERTRDLAEKQAQLQEPASGPSVTMAELAPDLQHVLFWMANAVELLYFLQQKCPLYVQAMEAPPGSTAGSRESLLSCALTASEEAMAVLEEVTLYAFQQCVYYISKSLYTCLPALLECPPFPVERRESWSPGPRLPEELHRVVSVYQDTLDLLRQLQVHPEIATQMLAYLFFFSSTLLLNQLLDRGPSLSCFHWPKGVQAFARLQQLLEWARGAGLGAAGEQFFRKLSCTLNLLATPSAQLVQMTWATLRATFPALRPAQLHRLLTQYQLASAMGPTSAWEPGAPDSPDACKSEDVLESYENPPPIVLPSDGFQVDLEMERLHDPVYQHLLYLRHFLWGLQSGAGPGGGPPTPESLEGSSEGQHSPLDSQPPGRSRATLSRQPSHGPHPPSDPSCLLTPPSTPLELEPSTQDWPEPNRKTPPEMKGSSPQYAAMEGVPGVSLSSSSSSLPEDPHCSLVVVELERGPSGLGMGLVDGLHTPLGTPGLYIQTLLPGSPAALDGRLSLGDRLLDVDGTSLVGIGYLRAVDLIRHGGRKTRFLVAKSDAETARKVRFRAPPT
ncbi:ras-associating and dilute domain-containing protein isoform X1 [Tenrec ecaudatus]|uniref:ras-associating and dilute domain-containing protein isoform X1 n=1 Tax=Tenrec ecaudatus TaxID=94439 RepID=UPI003F5A0EB0